MRNKNGQFISGHKTHNRLPVGAVRVRTREKRGGEQRSFIKVAEPNKWVLLSRYTWERHNGRIPANMGIHHKDGNKLNDDIDNLELVSKKRHLEIHRKEFQDKAVESWVKARKEQRWSTKSKTKITGRHPKGCSCPIHKNV